MKNELGTRMKDQYESRSRVFLPRRTYTLIRIDGKAFHTYTKKCKKPYDEDLMAAMDFTAEKLCESIQGAKFGYVQSDEISLLLTDFESITTSAWFDGNIQKITSISASIATAYFNQKRQEQGFTSMALFDSRVFVIPDSIEVENYFIWRQSDAVRNSILMTADTYFSTKQIHKKNTGQLQEMLFQEKGINWNDMPDGFKRGRIVEKTQYEKEGALRNKWMSKPAYWFTKEREVFEKLIPLYPKYQKEEV